MNASEIGWRYAKALYEMAEENGELEAIRGDMERIANTLSVSKDLQGSLSDPFISSQDKTSILEKVFAGISSTTALFLKWLTKRKRVSHLNDIYQTFQALDLEKHNIVKAEVISAEPLSDNQLSSLATRLGKRLNKTLRLAQKEILF